MTDASDMRERAAKVAQDMIAETVSQLPSTAARLIAAAIRALPLPEPNPDAMETAREMVAAITKQNWKHGGVLVMDTDEAESLIAAALAEKDAEIERLRKENDVLRGIATKIMPCHYCGADEIAKCPYGFPGCSLADDLLSADETQVAWMAGQRKKFEAAEARVAELERALVMYDNKARDVQNYWGDPSGYTHNTLLAAQLVYGDTVAKARAALGGKP